MIGVRAFGLPVNPAAPDGLAKLRDQVQRLGVGRWWSSSRRSGRCRGS